MRKKPFFVITFLVVGLALLFSAHGIAAQKRFPAKKKPSTPSTSNLNTDQQAEQQARAFWNSRMTKCGSEFYTIDGNFIHQLRNPDITVRANPVSQADRLNRIEYLGLTTLTVELSRTYSRTSNSYQSAGWSRWSQGFTTAMGGTGVYASIRKENGRWSITASSITQAGNLKPISCADAAAPSAFFHRREESSYSAEIRSFRERAESYGIYAKNISPAMWKALYVCGGSQTRAYSTVGRVYLAPNGGWLVSGGSCTTMSPNLLSEEARQAASGKIIEQVTADGKGYVLINRGVENGRLARGFVAEGVPQPLINRLQEFHNAGNRIIMVRIGYRGEWFALMESLHGVQNFSWSGMPETADQAFQEIDTYNKQSSKSGIKDVAFTPDGGYLILNNRNGYYSWNLPEEAIQTIERLSWEDKRIRQASFGPDGSWIIMAN